MWARLDSNQRPTDYESAQGFAAVCGCSLIRLSGAVSTCSAGPSFAAVSGCRVAPRLPRRDGPTAHRLVRCLIRLRSESETVAYETPACRPSQVSEAELIGRSQIAQGRSRR